MEIEEQYLALEELKGRWESCWNGKENAQDVIVYDVRSAVKYAGLVI